MTFQGIQGDRQTGGQERGSSVGMVVSSFCGTAETGQGVAGKGAGSSERGQDQDEHVVVVINNYGSK